MEFDARRITAEETIPLRHSVLRPGRPVAECVFPGDDDELTFHGGALLDGRIVSIASMYLEAREGAGHPDGAAWRLRGMATEPELRGSGAGRVALEACIEHVRAQGGELLWCNARTEAVGFYERLGWTVLGEEFDIPTVGPHFVMERSLRVS